VVAPGHAGVGRAVVQRPAVCQTTQLFGEVLADHEVVIWDRVEGTLGDRLRVSACQSGGSTSPVCGQVGIVSRCMMAPLVRMCPGPAPKRRQGSGHRWVTPAEGPYL